MSGARVDDKFAAAVAPGAPARPAGGPARIDDALRATGAGTWEWRVAADDFRASPEWLGALGYGPAEGPGTWADFLDLLHPADRPRIEHDVRQHLHGATPDWECVGRFRRHDGTYQWRRERCAAAERAADGMPVRVAGVGFATAGAWPGDDGSPWQHVFHQTAFGMSVANAADNTFIAVNEAFARMHGYTPEQLVGQPVGITCGAPLKEPVEALAARVAREGYVVGEFPHRRQDGSTFPALQEIRLVQGRQGHPDSRVSFVIDMSERERAVQALRRSEARLRAAYRNAAVGMVLTDADGRLLEVNPVACAMLGYTEDELYGMRFHDVTHADDVADSVARRARLLSGAREPEVFEKRYLRKDGSPLWAQVSLSVVEEEPDGRATHLLALIEDISSRRRATEALREREQQLRMALDAADAGTFAFDIVNDRVAFSPHTLAMYGFAPGATPTFRECLDRYHPADRVRVETAFAAAMAARTDFDAEYRILPPGRPALWLHARGRGVYDEDGRLLQAVGVKIDITARKTASEQLQSSEERFRLVAEATRDVLWDWDVTTGDHWWSPNATTLFGFDPVTERDISAWTSRLHPEDRQRVLGLLDAAIRGHLTSWDGEYRFRVADGTYGEFLDRGHVVRDDSGRAVRMIGAMTDVTEVKRAHRSLIETHERLRALVRDVHMAESRERAALARELHDEFGQLLTAAKLNASWLKAHVPATPTLAGDAYREKAANLCDVIDMALHGVRHVATQLRPPALDQLGLPRALQGLAAQVERHAGFDCQVTTDDVTRAAVFGPAEGAALYRMAQELLTNAARHAGAAHVRVSLTTSGERVILAVRDDGRGLTPADVARSVAWGLKGIRERAELLGGTMTIDSRAGAGTTVTVVLPRGGA